MRHGDGPYSTSRAVQRNPTPVEITLADGASLWATLFVPIQGRITDVMNDDRPFLPVECDGEYLALAKSAIRQVRMPRAQNPARVRCPYAVLGLHEGASIEDIKRTYRELCTANHPDRVKGAGLSGDFVDFAHQKMTRINNAYAELTKSVSHS